MRLAPSFCLILSLAAIVLNDRDVRAQDATGTLPSSRPPATGGRGRPAPGRDTSRSSARPPTPICNEDGSIVLQCGTPNCTVTLNKQFIGSTDSNGEMHFTAHSGIMNLTVSKAGYKSSSAEVRLGCGETKAVTLKPFAPLLQVRVHTSPPNTEVRINQVLQGRSNDVGLLVFNAAPERTLLVVSKPGYLSDTQILDLAPQTTPREIAVALMPIPAKLLLQMQDGIEGVRLAVDETMARYDAREPLQLAPGPHRIMVEALGYAPDTIEVTAVAGGSESRVVNLLRLSPADLRAQAEDSYRAKLFAEVYTLCKYLLEAEPQAAFAHRLMGLSYLAQGAYPQAEQHLKMALDGNETFTLNVRRHPGEKFDMQKLHTNCPATLTFRKNEVAFKGLAQSADDFQVPYGQVQIKNIQIRYNTVVFLDTSVTMSKGKRKEFNFYSYDNELSQSGRPYLELLGRLLQR
jgi:tetratricopeptide (TPR) repeat protein